MVRLSLVIAMLFGLLVGVMPVSAQDAAPAGPKLGEPATIYDNTGEPVGTITVSDIVDPYTNFDVINSSPARGFHWVIATVTIAATTATMPVNTSGFVMIDSGGFAGYQGYYYQTSDEAASTPMLNVSEVAAGESVTGAVYFQVFNGEKPAIIEYSPTYEQVIVALDLRAAGTKAGDIIEWIASDGSKIGELSVAGVVDPLEDFDSSSPPQRGFRYVAVAIHFKNTGTRPVQLSSYSFSAIDQEGFTVSSTGVYRTAEGIAALPDFPYDPVQPGSEITGIATFLMINGSSLKDVTFVPTSDRRIRVADFAKDATFTPPVLQPVATVAVDPACESVMVWNDAVTAAVAPVAAAFELLDKISAGDTTVTPDAVRKEADTFRAAADAVKALDTPDAAQASADQVSGVVTTMADLLEKIGDDLEAGNTDAVTAGIASVYEQAFSLAGGAIGDLTTLCPGIGNS